MDADDPLGLGMKRQSSRNLTAPPRPTTPPRRNTRPAPALPTQRPLPPSPTAPAPQPEPEAPPAAAPAPASPGSAGKRAPPPLASLSRKPPPLPAAGDAPAGPLRERLSANAYGRLQATFSGAGDDGTAEGELTTSQVKAFLVAQGIEGVDDQYVQDCMTAFDKDNSGTIDLDEFGSLVEATVPALLVTGEKPWDTAKDKFGAFAGRHAQKLPLSKEDYDAMSLNKRRILWGGCCSWCCALLLFLLQILLVLLEEECIEQEAVTLCRDSVAVEFSSDVEPAVDIVFAVDKSDSMGPVYDLLANNFETYVSGLSDNSSQVGDRWRMIVANSNDGCHTNEGGFIDVHTPPPGAGAYFDAAVNRWDGDRYPRTEMLLASATEAVEHVGAGECNEGFLRDNALLHVVLVSEASTPYESLLPRLRAAKNNDPQLVKVSAFRNYLRELDPYLCAQDPLCNGDVADDTGIPAGVTQHEGYGYKEAAEGTGGLDADVSTPDWTHACYDATGPMLPTCAGNEDLGPCAAHDENPPPEPPTGGVCALDLNGDGGDAGYTSALLDGGTGGFSLEVSFTSYTQRDQLHVCKGTCPGCVEFGAGTGQACTAAQHCNMADFENANNCLMHDDNRLGECVGVTGRMEYIEFPETTAQFDVQIDVHPNCQGGSGTAWKVEAHCTPNPPPPPPAPVESPPHPTCADAPPCVLTPGVGQGYTVPAGEASCYRNLIEELAQEAKVFGRYSVPAMPDATNYTDLTVSVGSQVKTQGVHWDLVNLEHRDGDAVIQFDCTTGRPDPYCNDAAFFSGGAAQIRVQWEQDKLGGCFTTTPPACPDNSHCWVCYILFFLLLVFICCGTYAKIVRKHAIKPPPPILINVQDLNGNTHEVEINETMSVSDIKALIEKLCGVPIEEIRLFNEEFSTIQLEGPKMCGECGLISTGGAPPKTLTMMVTWTLFVREDPPDNAATAKAREMGLDLAAKIHTLEGVEKHWKIESVKLRIEQVTGIPPADQQLFVTTTQDKRPLEDGTKLPDYFPDVHNRSELVLVDKDPDRKARAAQQGPQDKKKSMGADSVLSMARMFQSGHQPGNSLSELKEDSLVAKKEAYYSALMGGNKFEKAGIKLGARAHANLMGRAGRARGMHDGQIQGGHRP